MLTIDCRCHCSRCQAQSRDIYRMIGDCWNCGTKGVLMLFRAGDPSYHSHKCPVCKNETLKAKRLATQEEIPAA